MLYHDCATSFQIYIYCAQLVHGLTGGSGSGVSVKVGRFSDPNRCYSDTPMLNLLPPLPNAALSGRFRVRHLQAALKQRTPARPKTSAETRFLSFRSCGNYCSLTASPASLRLPPRKFEIGIG